MNTAKIRVLVIDDSALIRKLLPELLSRDPGIEVVGTASDPFIAREKIKQLNPDVLTLDVEMPRMDGVSFLKNLMRLRPMPVVMFSSLTAAGAELTLDTLDIGAVDFMTKPKLDLTQGIEAYAEELIAKVKAAAQAKVRPYAVAASTDLAPAARVIASARLVKTTDKLIAIGASTGGTEAIQEVLLGLPPDVPGVVMTQHIPEAFSQSFAQRLHRNTALIVKQAEDGDLIQQGHAFLAPGNLHLRVVRDGARYRCRLDDGPPVNRHKPSVDVLFDSVAQAAGPNCVAMILTGMGGDGAEGMKRLRATGAHTIAQDEASSVVWGMPGEAVKRGAACEVLPLAKIAGATLAALKKLEDGT